jgi:hypothetical protein
MSDKQQSERTLGDREIMTITVKYRDGNATSYTPIQFVELLSQKMRAVGNAKR